MNKKLKIIDPVGLHARPASLMVQKANAFPSNEIKVVFNSKEANLKSIMSVMALGVKNNDEIEIVVEGDNAETVLNELETVMKENKLI